MLGGQIENIKVDSRVFGVANCMDVLSSTEKMKTGREAVCWGNDEFTFDTLSLWCL